MNYKQQLAGVGSLLGFGFGAMTLWKSAIFYGKCAWSRWYEANSEQKESLESWVGVHSLGGLSRSFDKEFWNYAKLISGVLRHGMPIPFVVDLIEDLNLYSDNINTWKNGVVRTLKQFIPDGTKATDKACPSCGDSEGLVYEEGCLNCKSCGHSKCG